MQIYNEKIFDLMQDKRRQNPLQLRDTHKDTSTEGTVGATGSVHVRGMSVYRVYSKEEAMQLLKQGMRNRAIRATDFNNESSRSHTILQLFVTVEDVDEQGLMVLRRSTFSLVDLAGSEKWRSSLNASASSSTLQAEMKEMTHINTSLHVLGNCVSALIEPNRKHIPFRDSALTRLLQDPLGGNGRTILIATIHADVGHKDETYSTLQFANRASRIKVALTANVGINERANLAEAQRQIKMLRAKLQELQQQGGSGSRSRDGSVSPSARKKGEDSSPSTCAAVSSATCTICLQNEKLIAALRAKVIELHNENQLLRGASVTAMSTFDFNAPQFKSLRKPLPLGSSLSKLSPSVAAWEGQQAGADWLNSSMNSMSSMDSQTPPAVVRKKKKKADSATQGKIANTVGATGKTFTKEKKLPGEPAHAPVVSRRDGAEESVLDEDTVKLPELDAPAVDESFLPENCGAEVASIIGNDRVSQPGKGTTKSSAPPLSEAQSPSLRPKSSAQSSAPTVKTTPAAAMSPGLPVHSKISDNNLRFSDSSIEKALKAANLILGAPPSDTLSLLQMMSSDSSISQFPSSYSSPKKKKKAKASKGSSSGVTPEKMKLPGGGQQQPVEDPHSSPSPPRSQEMPVNASKSHPAEATKVAKPDVLNPYLQPPFQLPPDSKSQASASAARTGNSDFLSHAAMDGLRSPPMRKTGSSRSEAQPAASNNNQNSSYGLKISTSGMGVAATSSSPLDSRVPGSTLTGTAPTPLPMLTPARRLHQNSNPDACAKHGLDQCVLCRMFGEDGSSGGSESLSGAGFSSSSHYGVSNSNPPLATAASLAPQDSYYADGSGSGENNNYNGGGWIETQSANEHYFSASGSANHLSIPYQQQPVDCSTNAAAPERKRSSKPKSKAAPRHQQTQQHDQEDSAPGYSHVSSNYHQPPPIQMPPTQQQPSGSFPWQNRSSDFSPSGVYGSTLEFVQTREQQPPPQQFQPQYYQQSAVSDVVEGDVFPVTCKIHGVTECLLCTMRDRDAQNSSLSMNFAQQQQYQPQQQQSYQQQGYGQQNVNMGAPSPYRHAPQHFISTVDSADSQGGYGFSSSPSPLRSSTDAPFGAHSSYGGGPNYTNNSYSQQTQHQYQSHYQQQQTQHHGASQVRNVKSIAQHRNEYQSQYQVQNNFDSDYGDDLHQRNNGQFKQKPYAQTAPDRSMFGNSVQTVQALRQGGDKLQQQQQQQMLFPRSSSSPLPAVQQSILPSIMQECDFHPQVSAHVTDRQYSNAGRSHQHPPPTQQQESEQAHYQQEYHAAAGGGTRSNITYLDEEGEEIGGSDEEDNRVGTAGTSKGRAVGRTVIKKKKKVKKKLTKKTPSSAAAALAAPPVTGTPYGASTTKRKS